MNDSVNFPPIPGYVSVKEAAELLGLSPRTVYDYIEEGRLPSARLADVIAISREEIRKFKREPSGRPRKNTPLWHISSGDNTQFMSIISVQLRAGQRDVLQQKLEVIRKKKQHLFPGTVMRYVAASSDSFERVILLLVWRGTVLPDETTREEALEEFRRSLDDVLDWSTAHYEYGPVLMHT
jgi:excisionase family DNA binding protein